MSRARTLFISFRQGTDPGRMHRIVRALAPGQVLDVRQVTPEIDDPELARLAYAYVSADADLPALSRRIADLEDVESVSEPARRGLPRRPGA